MLRVRRQLRLATANDANVLLVGPPGSGREYIARSIHYGRSAAAPPLAPLACQLLDAELLETTVRSFLASCGDSELDRPPTLLLLEVDQLAADAQTALAAVFDGEDLNLRTLATARAPVLELAAQERFRPDLAAALSTLVITIPPLRERPEDIPLVAQWFLERANAAGGRQLAGFTDKALDRLAAYTWPENVEELAEAVREACARAAGPYVQAGELPELLRHAEQAEAHPPPREETVALDEFLAEIERELLQRAMRRSKGTRAAAARLLDISRARLLRRLEHFGLA
jgi:two-component system response regulator AtoC